MHDARAYGVCMFRTYVRIPYVSIFNQARVRMSYVRACVFRMYVRMCSVRVRQLLFNAGLPELSNCLGLS